MVSNFHEIAICTRNTIENESIELHNIFLKIGYPDKFIQVIKEHHPVGLAKGTISTIRSSILKHLMDSNHVINSERAFKILYRTPVSQYHSTRLKHLNMAEAILINFYKPELCSQKKLFHNILLPWPSLFRWKLFYCIVYFI